ncbi:MAG: CoA transferase [Chloroflexi bacterium]|nr:CoA transferase [Chloroflexota bacterium]
MPSGCLEGITVLDMGQMVAGPYCARLLATLGATVIKIERPGVGDVARSQGPFPHDQPDPESSGLFLYLNTGKKCVTLNLGSRTGRLLFRELVARSDILVENFRPGVMERLGQGYRKLHRLNPRLVMTSISNFGQSGPYRDYRATDMGLLAMGGYMYVSGDPDREPLRKGEYLAQYLGGLNAHVGTLGAFWHALESGIGQRVDVSIMEAVATLIETSITYYAYKGIPRKRFSVRSGIHPFGVYPCRDGFVGIQVVPARMWPVLVEMVGREELRDPKFATGMGRSQHADEVDALLLPWLLQHGRNEIYHMGQQRGIGFGLVCTPADMLDSPHLKAREFFLALEHPQAGTYRYPGVPAKFSETAWRAQRAPLLGEHNEELLCGLLGHPTSRLAEWREQGVI